MISAGGFVVWTGLGCDLVEPGGQPFGETPGVGEHDRGSMLADELGDPFLDVGPQRRTPDAARGRAPDLVLDRLAEFGHVLDGDDDLEIPFLDGGGCHDLDGGRSAEEAGHLLERSHRGRQPDPLRGPGQQGVETLERQGEVGATLGAGDRVHLVDDDGLHATEHLARLRGEHEEQRLRRGDHDVGRRRGQPSTIGGRRVTRAQADPDLRHSDAKPVGRVPDAGERSAQVAFHIDRERLQRRDVEDPAALLLCRNRSSRQPVERPQERRQGLARTRRRDHERVLSTADRVPSADLGGSRLGECRLEPCARGFAERSEGIERGHRHILPHITDNPRRE